MNTSVMRVSQCVLYASPPHYEDIDKWCSFSAQKNVVIYYCNNNAITSSMPIINIPQTDERKIKMETTDINLNLKSLDISIMSA